MKKGEGGTFGVASKEITLCGTSKFYCVSYTLCLSSAEIFHTINGVQSTHKITPQVSEEAKIKPGQICYLTWSLG